MSIKTVSDLHRQHNRRVKELKALKTSLDLRPIASLYIVDFGLKKLIKIIIK